MGNLFFVSSWRRFKSNYSNPEQLNLEILLSDPIVLMGVRPCEHWSVIRGKISAKTGGRSASNDTTHPRNLFWVLLIVITSHDATKHVLRSQVPVWLMKKSISVWGTILQSHARAKKIQVLYNWLQLHLQRSHFKQPKIMAHQCEDDDGPLKLCEA